MILVRVVVARNLNTVVENKFKFSFNVASLEEFLLSEASLKVFNLYPSLAK